MNKIAYWLALSQAPQLGPLRLNRLWQALGTAANIWQADKNELQQAGLDQRSLDLLLEYRRQTNPEKLLTELDQHDIKAICWEDDDYPHLLKQIYDPPPVIYFKGSWNQTDINLAIVGTRKISTYGQAIVKKIIPEIVRQQITTVSGLALGVDGLVHQETIQAGGKTIAVLGSGLDNANLYPTSNRYLVEKIINSDGLVLSEYPPGTPPLPQHFPRRNRIIAGLAQGTLVIEADLESGSLITASYALEQNREVMAIPGSIFANGSSGTNKLIKQGAKLVDNINDILDCLQLQIIDKQTSQPFTPANDNEKKIYDTLSSNPIALDEIIRQTQLDSSTVNTTISLLEIKGVVKNVGNNHFIKMS